MIMMMTMIMVMVMVMMMMMMMMTTKIAFMILVVATIIRYARISKSFRFPLSCEQITRDGIFRLL